MKEVVKILKDSVDYVEVCGHETRMVQMPRKSFQEAIERLESLIKKEEQTDSVWEGLSDED